VIYLYSLADKKFTPVTTDFYGSWNPMFDPEGKYLYFLSNRDYNEVIGVYDSEFSNPKAYPRFHSDSCAKTSLRLRSQERRGKRQKISGGHFQVARYFGR